MRAERIEQPVLEVENLVTRFGSQTVHDGISFAVRPGTIVSLIGGSGSGKSVLLKEIIGLLRPSDGTIKLFGIDMHRANSAVRQGLRNRFGVLFQYSALFSALTAGENVEVPLREHTALSDGEIEPLARLLLALTGLEAGIYEKFPSDISGGMRKRVALARALALQPELLFLDEPTSGLDPITARAFDQLIKTLRDSLGLTVFMATHDLDSILSVSDTVIVLDRGKMVTSGSPAEVVHFDHPWIKEYFSSRLGEIRP